ncbi:HD-GYP domain-containing protein [Methylophilus sp. 14]|uniref:HD-GYP domain-containing protein n=1 Tax=Methylophilus sp. 14 TaxID=2781019 RepID=UPI00188EBBD0|nr:HD domain-containing phosphohydrolase [Methylophilus sp. 14]MBF4987175.1 HD domain-containing protein [Methylophilus sp. 14]
MTREADDHSGVLKLSAVLADALRQRDAYTRLHSDRVMALANGIGVALGLSGNELHVLELGASLHDIGKIVVPDVVLMKPGRLDDAEMRVMQLHPSVGGDLIAAYEHPRSEPVSKVIRHHHEWFDGSGYPDNLAGEGIPLLARIVTLVDNYDAMAVRRVYQGARPHHEIMQIMESEAGTKLDPEMFKRFVQVIDDPRYAMFKAS